MDANHFDAITKMFAEHPSRRRLLWSAAGSAAGGLLTLLGVGAATAANKGKRDNEKKRKGDKGKANKKKGRGNKRKGDEKDAAVKSDSSGPCRGKKSDNTRCGCGVCMGGRCEPEADNCGECQVCAVPDEKKGIGECINGSGGDCGDCGTCEGGSCQTGGGCGECRVCTGGGPAEANCEIGRAHV